MTSVKFKIEVSIFKLWENNYTVPTLHHVHKNTFREQTTKVLFINKADCKVHDTC